MSSKLKIIFMGTPNFSIPSLKEFNLNHEILAVVTQPPKPSGRGMNIKKSSVQIFSENHGLKIIHPTSLNDSELITELNNLQPDIIVVVAYGLILSQTILNIPKFGCINGHASLLPKWRGAAPIQRCIEAGDKETGSTAILMEQGLDSGPILLRKKINILYNEDVLSIQEKISRLTAECLIEATEKFVKKEIFPKKQNSINASYANKITKIDGIIEWNMTSQTIYNKLRAFKYFPGIFTNFNNHVLKIINGKPIKKKHQLKPGTILNINKELLIACGEESVFSIEQIQKAGKKIISATDFINGSKIKKGDIFY